MDKKILTINDIAQLAGVAKSTVSRYLNNGSVSEKTRVKLDQIVQENNYTPNSFAQSLKAKQSNLIGTIVPRLDSYSIVLGLQGLDKIFNQMNKQLLILNSYQSIERELEAIRTLEKQKVDGIIFYATELTQAHYEILASLSVPIIIMGQNAPHYYSINYSDYEAGVKIGELIHQLKHQDVYYFGVSARDIAVGVNRRKGVEDTLKKYGIDNQYIETSFHTQDAYEKARLLLQKKIPTFIACATDNIALGVIKAANELGIQVPEQLSVSGFGGYQITDDISPTITTVKIEYEYSGQIAAKNILALSQNEKIPKQVYIQNRLEEKQSTKQLTKMEDK